MRDLHKVGAKPSGKSAVVTAMLGHHCGGTRQFLAARTLIHRFFCDSKIETLENPRKLVCL
jgi:hypothetical protein